MASVALPTKDEEAAGKTASPGRVILYNDDWHTFDDVARQLVKAIACTYEEGERHAFIVHTQGRSMVYTGARDECERVAGVLRQIRLQVEVDWD